MPGLEPYGRATALEALFNGVDQVFVGLLDVLPVDGLGEVEIAPPGYARVLHQDWITNEVDGVTSRCNTTAIQFGTYPVDVTMRGWAVWDAPVAGNLMASGIFFDVGGGLAGQVTVDAGDDIEFQVGQFCISLGQDCPIVFGDGDGDGDGDTCSDIDTITVENLTAGGGPVAWSVGDPAIPVAFMDNIEIVVTLVAPSTDMPGFGVTVTNSGGPSVVGAGSVFTVQFSAGPAGVNIVEIENVSNSPVCTYSLGAVTEVT